MYKKKLDDAWNHAWDHPQDHPTPDEIRAQIAAACASGGLDSITARTMQGFMVLAGALNVAQSMAPAEIRDALKKTNLASSRLIAHYEGVHFNGNGQNDKASVLLSQLQGSKYVPVWPEEVKEAGTKLFPYMGSDARANFGDGTDTPPAKSGCH
jgi:hypothetical protein